MENPCRCAPTSPDYKRLYEGTAAELDECKKRCEAAVAEAGWLRNELNFAEAKLEMVYLIFGKED